MDKKQLQPFLVKARSKTYAAGGGKVKPVFRGSTQHEFKENKWLYRDVYYVGNGLFMGLESVYFGEKPVWSMSYYGNFQKMTERQIDEILRRALIENKEKTRLWYKVEWKNSGYKYLCTPDGPGSIDKMGGMEEIYKGKEKVYFFFYAGGFIG